MGTLRDDVQVVAFKVFYKTLDGTIESRFAEAIVLTSDEECAKHKNNPMLTQGIGSDAFRVFDILTRELQEGMAITEFLTAMLRTRQGEAQANVCNVESKANAKGESNHGD